jgi:hypothetical protein
MQKFQQRIVDVTMKVRRANEIAKKLQNSIYFAPTLRLSTKG